MSTLSDVIKHDHREIEEYWDKALNSATNDEKERYANMFVWELARHSIGEEIVVYPLLEKKVENGKAMADNDRQEHNELKVLLNHFQNLKPTDAAYETDLRKIMETLSPHIKEEENEDLPKLESKLSHEESVQTAKEFHLTKKFVPTRSHPSAPDQPPFETVVGLMTAPIDMLGDMFRKWPRD